MKSAMDVIKGLDIIEPMLDAQREDNTFVNVDALVEVVEFLRNYVKTHTVEITTSLDIYMEENNG